MKKGNLIVIVLILAGIISCAGLCGRKQNYHTPEPVHVSHGLTRLRGAMIGREAYESTIRNLRGLGGNSIRWMMSYNYHPRMKTIVSDNKVYNTWLDSELDRLYHAAQVCEEEGILMVVSLATPPGDHSDNMLFRIFPMAI